MFRVIILASLIALVIAFFSKSKDYISDKKDVVKEKVEEAKFSGEVVKKTAERIIDNSKK